MTNIQQTTLRKLAVKNFILSILINWGVVYYSFEGPGAMYLFAGTYPIARFLFPMSFLLPFLISFDILKQSVKTLIPQKHDNLETTHHRTPKTLYLLSLALKSGIMTFIPTTMGLFVLYYFLPKGYSIEKADCAIFIGLLSGVMAVLFTYTSINKAEKILRI